MENKEIKMDSFQLGQQTVTHKNMILNALFSQAIMNGMTFIDAMVKKLLSDRVEASKATENKIDTADLIIVKDSIPFKSAMLKLLNEQVPPTGISFGEMKLRLKLIDLIEAVEAGKTLELPEGEYKELTKVIAAVKSTVTEPVDPATKEVKPSILDKRLAIIQKISDAAEGSTLSLTNEEFKDAGAALMSMRWTVMDKNIAKFVQSFED